MYVRVCVCIKQQFEAIIKNSVGEENCRKNTDGKFSQTKQKPGSGSYSTAGHIRHVVLIDIRVCVRVCVFPTSHVLQPFFFF